MAGTKSNTREWYVYALHINGVDIYVGRTFNPNRRVRQHRPRFGNDISIRILETGIGHYECVEAERGWMERLRGEGVNLQNKLVGGFGCWEVDVDVLEKISAASKAKWKDPVYRDRQLAAMAKNSKDPEMQKRRQEAFREMMADPIRGKHFRDAVSAAFKGKKLSDEIRAKMSKAQTGLKKTYTPESLLRAREKCYVKGVNNFELLSDEAKERKRVAARKTWDDIPPEERTRMAVERNEQMWADRDATARKEIGKRIRDGQIAKQGLEAMQERARVNGAKSADRPGMREDASRNIKAFWANMTPAQRKDYLDRRTKKIAEAMALKKSVREDAGLS